jgi:hypothetical protein
MTLTWKKSFAGNETRIFREKLIAGILKTNTWNGHAHGELNGYMLVFKPLGFWKTGAKILDIEGRTELGSISYKIWKQTAEITYSGESFTFSYKSWTHQKWEVKGAEGSVLFESTGFWGTKGNISFDNVPGAIMLSALYVHSFFSRMNAAAAS